MGGLAGALGGARSEFERAAEISRAKATGDLMSKMPPGTVVTPEMYNAVLSDALRKWKDLGGAVKAAVK
jgi:hypothetical protein